MRYSQGCPKCAQRGCTKLFNLVQNVAIMHKIVVCNLRQSELGPVTAFDSHLALSPDINKNKRRGAYSVCGKTKHSPLLLVMTSWVFGSAPFMLSAHKAMQSIQATQQSPLFKFEPRGTKIATSLSRHDKPSRAKAETSWQQYSHSIQGCESFAVFAHIRSSKSLVLQSAI